MPRWREPRPITPQHRRAQRPDRPSAPIEAQAEAAGKSLPGSKPGPDRALQAAEAALAAATAAASAAAPVKRRAKITDSDSRVMKTQQGWLQGYNAQTVAD